MRIVITDTSFLWKNQEPILEQFKDELLIVCLGGKAVTDKYECFVCSVEGEQQDIKRKNIFKDSRYNAMESVADDFDELLGDHDDVLFLTDDDSSTLYPFCSLEFCRYENRKVHLCTIAPFRFDLRSNLSNHKLALSVLQQLTSILYIDSNTYLKNFSKETTVLGLVQNVVPKIREDYLAALPFVVDNIESLDGKYYFDLSTNTYVNVINGMDDIDPKKGHLFNPKIINDMQDVATVLGNFVLTTPINGEATKAKIEELQIRKDGKQICKYLRNLRIELAKANGIEFSPEECTSKRQCAGTCPACDQEAAYLREKLNEISPEYRIIPNSNLREWNMKND